MDPNNNNNNPGIIDMNEAMAMYPNDFQPPPSMVDLMSFHPHLSASPVVPPQSDPSQPLPPTANPAAPPTALEDAVGEEVTTFNEYTPSSLPTELVEILCNDSAASKFSEDGVVDTHRNNWVEKDPAKPLPKSHAFPTVESSLMSSVTAPQVPPEIFASITPFSGLKYDSQIASLTPCQMEGAGLAINAFRKVYVTSKSTTRAGFFIGDGAGVGKGRQITSVVRHSTAAGNPRHLWLSVSRSLIDDARRDLEDVGLVGVPVHSGDMLNSQKGLGKTEDGVLFITYQMLISNKRMEQIISWLGPNGAENFGGCIVFDECHKAKNLGESKTSQAVIDLQKRLPMGRVLYCSATGVSDVKHMVYAERLNLWGPSTPYPSFDHFSKMLNDRGIGGLEMLSLEMKLQGRFIARSLSWDGALFQTCECKLSKEMEHAYDQACGWWLDLRKGLKFAQTKLSKIREGAVPKTMMRVFWSAMQRFFKEFAVCSKVNYIVENAKKDIESGHSVIIGLQATGEASTKEFMDLELEKMREEKGLKDTSSLSYEQLRFPALVSTVGGTARGFVEQHFPVKPDPPSVGPPPQLPPNPTQEQISWYGTCMRAREDAIRIVNMAPDEELLKMRDDLLAKLGGFDLPANPLDELVDKFGGEKAVAEMTGRTGRILRVDDEVFRYKKRAGVAASSVKGLMSRDSGEVEMDQLNIEERKRFQNGDKLVAIISDAASTGISLHANVTCKSANRRRVHYTIELPWAADKAIQQLGRSHRAGQMSAPIYRNCVTNLGGERRFAAAVSKRMESLGALTKGDRRAASGTDLSEFNIDSKHGGQALVRLYESLSKGSVVRPCVAADDVLDEFIGEYGAKLGLVETQEMGKGEVRDTTFETARRALVQVGFEEGSDVRQKADVKVFLNRIAGLPVSLQNLLFNLFSATLKEVIEDARKNGWYEGCVEDLFARKIERESSVQVAVDNSSGASTHFSIFVLDRGYDLGELIVEMKAKEAEEEGVGVGVGVGGGEEEEEEELEDDEMKGFIVDDSEEEDSGEDIEDEGEQQLKSPSKQMLSKSVKKLGPCVTGFYVSKRQITGRTMPIFAKRKFTRARGKSTLQIDPLGVMVIHRANTGKTGQELSSAELRHKYKLVQGLTECSGFEGLPSDFSDLWTEHYTSTNSLEKNSSLAPRLSKVGLVHGAVLHVFPALALAVKNSALKRDRTLKVYRVEHERKKILGVKFPVDKVDDLMRYLQLLTEARKGNVGVYKKLEVEGVDERKIKRMGKKENTMMTFFGAKGGGEGGEGKGGASVFGSTKRSSGVNCWFIFVLAPCSAFSLFACLCRTLFAFASFFS
ncbi:hypothetical protein TrLO_g14850 [Triparma laevis f. longispina]|uniref:Helicase ATP-binding domain-containing protein n=1 Tax=Triparma laevis f. longispina TaxID=1714387 RepID=A0A9W7KZL1_9STRA|nr:hypothetical protein TrLO_g14850 [Triparma laevis f. longispina]